MSLYKLLYVYILQCADGSYYIGITHQLETRVEQHNIGADPDCYTYKRRPVILVYSEEFSNYTDAIAREKQIKRWTRIKKEALIKGDFDSLKKHAMNTKKKLEERDE